MKPIVSTLLLSLSFITSQFAQAHFGHDHSHWMSNPIHILTIFAVAAVVVSCLLYKQLARRRHSLAKKEINHDS